MYVSLFNGQWMTINTLFAGVGEETGAITKYFPFTFPLRIYKIVQYVSLHPFLLTDYHVTTILTKPLRGFDKIYTM